MSYVDRSIGAVGAQASHEFRAFIAVSSTKAARPTWAAAQAAEQQAQADLLRDIFGNPFRPVSVNPTWLTWNWGAIPKLAQAIYDERLLPAGHLVPARLAVLADALEDASCTEVDILAQCRQPGPHVQGCWVIDLLKE